MPDAVDKWEVCEGNGIQVLPAMVARGAVPWPVAELIRQRASIWRQFGDGPLHSSDLVAIGGAAARNEVKLILTVDKHRQLTQAGASVMKVIEDATERIGCGIVLSEEAYSSLKGENVVVLSREGMKAAIGLMVSEPLAETEILAHAGWRVLLRHPDAVPSEYASDATQLRVTIKSLLKEIQKARREQWRQPPAGMQFCLQCDDVDESRPVLHQWHLTSLTSGFNAMGGFPVVAGVTNNSIIAMLERGVVGLIDSPVAIAAGPHSSVGLPNHCRFLADATAQPWNGAGGGAIACATTVDVSRLRQYRLCEGAGATLIPRMLSQNMAPLSVAELIRSKAEVHKSFPGESGLFGTSDLLVSGGQSSSGIKIILTVDNKGNVTEEGRRILTLVQPGNVVKGGIRLTEAQYAALTGANVIDVSAKDLAEGGELWRIPGYEGRIPVANHLEGSSTDSYRLYSDTVMRNHPVWRVLLRHPAAVPVQYAYPEEWVHAVASAALDDGTTVGLAHAVRSGSYIKLPIRCVGIEMSGKESYPRLMGWQVMIRSWDARLQLKELALGAGDYRARTEIETVEPSFDPVRLARFIAVDSQSALIHGVETS